MICDRDRANKNYMAYLGELTQEFLAKHFGEDRLGEFVDYPLVGPGGLRRQLGELDLEYFARAYFPEYFAHPVPQFHKDAYAELTEVLARPPSTTRKVRAWPRGNAKSTIYNFFTPMNAALYAKRYFIVIVSDTETQAQSFLADIKDAVETNKHIREDFGDLRGNVWRVGEIAIQLAPGVRTTIVAVGAESGVRGIRQAQHRPDLVVCQPKGNRVLVYGRGLVDISEVRVGDLVWTHNHTWEPVTRRYIRKYKGDLVRITPHGSPDEVTMTAEHPVYVEQVQYCPHKRKRQKPAPCLPCNAVLGKRSNGKPNGCSFRAYENYKPNFVRADQLKHGDILVYAPDDFVLSDNQIVDEFARFVGECVWDRSLQRHRAPTVDELSFVKLPAFWRFVGYWMAEGTVERYNPNKSGGRRIALTFSAEEVSYGDDVCAVLASIGTKCTPKAAGSVLTCAFANQILWAFFNKVHQEGRGHKVLPFFVEQLPLEYQRELVVGYFRGDGGWSGEREYVARSVCKDLLLQQQRILTRLGVVSCVRKSTPAQTRKFPHGYCQCQQQYVLAVLYDEAKKLGFDNGFAPQTTAHKKQKWFGDDGAYRTLINDISVERGWSGVVYNLCVGESHSYSGHLVTMHNCDDL